MIRSLGGDLLDELLLNARDISKHFSGVHALHQASLEVRPGEIHCLVGENGSGKTTMLRIIAGLIPPDEGQVTVQGAILPPNDVKASTAAGISYVSQEGTVADHLSVCENILLGRSLPSRWGFVRWKTADRLAAVTLRGLGDGLPLHVPVNRLQPADRQVVAIARGLVQDPTVALLDEVTSHLSYRHVVSLFRVMRRLAESQRAVVFVSHRLEEVFEVGDRVTVLRDGKVIGTFPVSSVSPDQLVKMMVGRNIENLYARSNRSRNEVRLRVRNFSAADYLKSISLDVRAGEVLGVGGLTGSGRSLLARSLVGAGPRPTGEIFINGEKVSFKSPLHALRRGVVYVPEDRRSGGLFPRRSVEENLLAAAHGMSTGWRLRKRSLERKEADRLRSEYAIRCASLDAEIDTLSGGNQQKVMLGRALDLDPQVLILDEPTRGIDVGAKHEVYELIARMTARGCACLLISSEIPELLGLADRIAVMRNGQIVGTADRSGATSEWVGDMAMGTSVT